MDFLLRQAAIQLIHGIGVRVGRRDHLGGIFQAFHLEEHRCRACAFGFRMDHQIGAPFRGDQALVLIPVIGPLYGFFEEVFVERLAERQGC